MTTEPVKLLKNYYPQYKIGEGTYGEAYIYSWGEGAVAEIGAYTSFAFGVKILLGGGHTVDWATTYPFSVVWPGTIAAFPGHPRTNGDVKIGNDVWVGAEALILSGVTIGDGAVIAARAVVTHNVPPYAIVGGNPARVIRERFDAVIVKRFLEIKWWSWDRERIARALPFLLNPNIERFFAEYDAGRL